MNRKVPLTALLVMLMACGSQDSPSTDAPVGGAVAADDTYTLKIVFQGLVAYAEDKDKVWAFLVDADYTDQDLDNEGLPPEASLPPGVLKEIQAGNVALHEFPAHLARLRLKNAEVVSGSIPEEGLPISGADLRFETGVQGLSIKLSELSSPDKISKARKGANEPDTTLLATLHQLDVTLLGNKVDPRLAARARIEAGSVEARLVNDCSGAIKLFSFQTLSNGLECPGDPANAVNLAEEVVVTQESVSQPTVIDLGSLGKIAIKPKDPAQDVIIEVLNQTKTAIEATKCEPEEHFGVFRWYYRLLSGAGASDTGNHLYPCPQQEPAGDPKCPQDLLIIPGT